MSLHFLDVPEHADQIAAALKEYEMLAETIEARLREQHVDFKSSVREFNGDVHGRVKCGASPLRLCLVARLPPQSVAGVSLYIYSKRWAQVLIGATHTIPTDQYKEMSRPSHDLLSEDLDLGGLSVLDQHAFNVNPLVDWFIAHTR